MFEWEWKRETPTAILLFEVSSEETGVTKSQSRELGLDSSIDAHKARVKPWRLGCYLSNIFRREIDAKKMQKNATAGGGNQFEIRFFLKNECLDEQRQMKKCRHVLMS